MLDELPSPSRITTLTADRRRPAHRPVQAGVRSNPWRLAVYPGAFEAICDGSKTVEPRAGFRWLARLQPGEYIEFLRLTPRHEPALASRDRRVLVRVTRVTVYRSVADLCAVEPLSAIKPGFEDDPLLAWEHLRFGIKPDAEAIALVAIEFERIGQAPASGSARREACA